MAALDTTTEGTIGRRARRAPEGPVGRSTGWWGMVLFICTEAATFAAFLASYFYLRFDGHGPWPPPSDKLPGLFWPSLATGILVLSCVPMAIAVRTARRDARFSTWVNLLLVFLSGALFCALTGLDFVLEWPESTVSKDAYGSLFFTIPGLHAVHVLVGVVMAAMLLLSVPLGRVARHPQSVSIVALYWYFLAVLAVAVYGTVYISPYL
jgi:heme/copper-type cytochrome/quinol oxidase subunit 3